jgi:hypothetical protein
MGCRGITVTTTGLNDVLVLGTAVPPFGRCEFSTGRLTQQGLASSYYHMGLLHWEVSAQHKARLARTGNDSIRASRLHVRRSYAPLWYTGKDRPRREGFRSMHRLGQPLADIAMPSRANLVTAHGMPRPSTRLCPQCGYLELLYTAAHARTRRHTHSHRDNHGHASTATPRPCSPSTWPLTPTATPTATALPLHGYVRYTNGHAYHRDTLQPRLLRTQRPCFVTGDTNGHAYRHTHGYALPRDNHGHAYRHTLQLLPTAINSTATLTAISITVTLYWSRTKTHKDTGTTFFVNTVSINTQIFS